MVDGIAGVMISTSPDRYPAMERFYVQLLPDRVRHRRPGFVNFEWPEGRLTVTVHSDVSDVSCEPARVIVNLETADIDREHRRAVGAGALSVRPPERESWGGMVCTFADPDGNLIQLMQFEESGR
jgi:catechol 2,3-dioxygenase-like lactoylglutathione lyase family enzyme